MSLYSRICFASSAVSLGTVGLLVWTATPSQAETSYIYFSLAAPTFSLSHHALYFFAPFSSSSTSSATPIYSFVPTSSSEPSSTSIRDSPSDAGAIATPTTKFRISRLCRRYASGWKHLLSISEEHNPMASSTLSIIVLIFLAVLVGAFAISAGAVAFLDILDSISAQKDADRLMALADSLPLPTGYNTTTSSTSGNTTSSSIEVPAPMSGYSGLDSTVPPTPILALQAALSLAQALLLGSLALVGMRIRSMHPYSGDDSSLADDESGLDLEWVYEDDECVEENK